MELRHLRAFVVVAEELHVHRAAERLHLAQPTVSRQIAALERDMGVPLFSRDRRRLALTAAGEVLLERSRELVARADEAVRDVERAHRGETGRVRLGFVQSATFEALPRLVRAFRAAHPDIVIDARPMTSLAQRDALGRGQLDVGLLRLTSPEPDLVTRTVSFDPIVAALPPAHPLAARERISLRELAEEPFVFYSRPEGPVVYDTLVAHCVGAGFSPRIVQAVPDVQSLIALVAAGIGVSLLLSPVPANPSGGVTFMPLANQLPRWETVVAWPDAPVTPAVRSFLGVVEQELVPFGQVEE